MTKDELISAMDDDATTPRPVLGQILVFLGVSFASGGLAAGIAIAMHKGLSLTAAIVTGALLLIGVGMLAMAVRIGNFEPPSLNSRTGRTQLILVLCVTLGALIGMYLTISGATDRLMANNFSLTKSEAIAALVILFGFMLPVGLYWQREIDEVERSAAKDAAYIALNVYIYGYLAMMIAASANLIPWVEGPIIFCVVLCVFLILWVIKRAG